jgi:hypothetical protein
MLKKSTTAKNAQFELLVSINELIDALASQANSNPEVFQITLEAKWLKASLEEHDLHLPKWELTIDAAAKDGFAHRHPFAAPKLQAVAKLLANIRAFQNPCEEPLESFDPRNEPV